MSYPRCDVSEHDQPGDVERLQAAQQLAAGVDVQPYAIEGLLLVPTNDWYSLLELLGVPTF